MVGHLEAALDRIDDARCLVLAATGEHFCAGGDFEATVKRADGSITPEAAIDRFKAVNALVERIYEWPSPTVARVDGAAFGAGCGLAMACDIVLASGRATFGFGFRRLGLSPGGGTSALLARRVGTAAALELLYTGELVDADRAHALGIATHVYPDAEFQTRADHLIETIADGPMDALAATKRLVRGARDRSMDAALAAEVDARRDRLDDAELREAADAFLDHRDPDFS
jgi:enoyl-CoA hydratase/carnithine racemase